MNAFMTDEKAPYEGDVDVVHTLDVLRELKGNSKAISAKIVKPLNGLRVASCTAVCSLRPRSVAFDHVENPVLLDDLVKTLGGKPIDWSHKTECCGAYQTVDNPKVVADRTIEIPVRRPGATATRWWR